MGAIELYSEAHRDAVEEQLAAERNKVDLMVRRNMGMVAILYWARDTGEVSVYVEDERTKSAAEYVVSPVNCLKAWRHAFAHEDANLDPYTQNLNQEGYGA